MGAACTEMIKPEPFPGPWGVDPGGKWGTAGPAEPDRTDVVGWAASPRPTGAVMLG